MSIAKKKLAGGGSAFSNLTHGAGEQPLDQVNARSEALDRSGRVRQASSVLVDDIVFNPLNPRKTLDEQALADMADSLLEVGQVSPITVVSRTAFLDAHRDFPAAKLGDASFVALEGNRRLRAARQAGLEKLRVDLNDDLASTASEMLQAALVANAHREGVPEREEAEAIKHLLDTVYDGNQAAVARKLGKSKMWVTQRLALLHLVPEVEEMLDRREISVKQARELGAATKAGTLSKEEQLARAEAVRAEAAKPRITKPRSEPAQSTAAPASPAAGSVNPVYPPTARNEVLTESGGGVNRVYPEASSDARSGPAAGGVNPVYPTGQDDADPGTVGLVSLTIDPSDAEGFAKAIRGVANARQSTALVRALFALLDAEAAAKADATAS